ncbi:MAG: hypothetical protein ACE5I5_05260 [Candidatus Heimdallarchaeota archaeon]
MVFVKTITRKTKDGKVRKYYYLAENYREGGKIKIRIIRRLSETDDRVISLSRREIPRAPFTKLEVEALWEAIVNLKVVCERLIARKADSDKEDWESERTLLRVVENLYQGTALDVAESPQKTPQHANR